MLRSLVTFSHLESSPDFPRSFFCLGASFEVHLMNTGGLTDLISQSGHRMFLGHCLAHRGLPVSLSYKHPSLRRSFTSVIITWRLGLVRSHELSSILTKRPCSTVLRTEWLHVSFLGTEPLMVHRDHSWEWVSFLGSGHCLCDSCYLKPEPG